MYAFRYFSPQNLKLKPTLTYAYFLKMMDIYLMCMHVYTYVYASGVCMLTLEHQKRLSYILEVKLQRWCPRFN